MTKVLVTGGSGFIGSAFVRTMAERGRSVVSVDAETYAGDRSRIADVAARVKAVKLDVNDPSFESLILEERPDLIVHFAAESHVTRSETGPDVFFNTNVVGTKSVLDAAERASVDLVLHISTDEVYGPCSGRPFREEDKVPGEGLATSAYARSKALADDLAASYSGGLPVPVIVARLTNCFGPWQHPEKAIARWSIRALTGGRLPVWGSGKQVRDWMFLDDACSALRLLVERGASGETYNVGPEGEQYSNLEIAKMIAACAGRDESCVYLTEYDRPQHDVRYAIDSSKIRSLGWNPAWELEKGMRLTVDWYRKNAGWWRRFVPEAERIYDDHAGKS